VCLAVLSAAGCRGGGGYPPPQALDSAGASDGRAGAALVPVALPEFESSTQSIVRAQIVERQQAVTALAREPRASQTHLAGAFGELGVLLMAAGYDRAAEPCYLNARTLRPNDYRWSYYLGHLHRNRGDLPTSAGFFAEALERRPDDVPTRVWLGETYLTLGRPDAAEPVLTRALEIEPQSAAVLAALGRLELARRAYARAVEHLEAALAAETGASSLRDPLAEAYRGLGRPQRAEAHLRQRGAGQPTLADPLMRMLRSKVEIPAVRERPGGGAPRAGHGAAVTSPPRQGERP
jgi:tetratricopeptide (TPR) repeat protein